MEHDQIVQDELFDYMEAPKKRWYLRIRYQFLVVTTLAVVFPIIILFQGDVTSVLRLGSLYNSLVAIMIAVLSTLFAVRRLNEIPGYASVGNLITTITTIFGLIAVAFFMARFDYSRSLFLVSFLIVIFAFVILHFIEKKALQVHMAVIPGGGTETIARMLEETINVEINDITWHFLSEPTGYRPGMGALVADLRFDHSEKWERFITEAAVKGIPVFHVKQVREGLSGRVEIDHLSENDFGSVIPSRLYLRVKQIADFCLAVIMLPFVLLIVAVLMPVIRLDTGGSAIFAQRRMGFRGEKFVCYKLRTMRADAFSAHKFDGQPEETENTARTRDNDERITALGRFLRRYRIDELPQCFNILKGEMSWIGPRPEAVPLSLEYEKALPFYRYRHIVRPGISGWAQVNQGHVTEQDQVLEKLHYDFYYIKHVSFALDLMIVVRTIQTILRGFGAR